LDSANVSLHCCDNIELLSRIYKLTKSKSHANTASALKTTNTVKNRIRFS